MLILATFLADTCRLQKLQKRGSLARIQEGSRQPRLHQGEPHRFEAGDEAHSCHYTR